MELVARSGNAGCTFHNLETIAAHAAERGPMEEATSLVTAAAALREATGHGYRVWEREGHRRVMAALGSRYQPQQGSCPSRSTSSVWPRSARDVLASDQNRGSP